MISPFSTLLDFSPYARPFIASADAVLRPYEARSVDRLMRRTIGVDVPLDAGGPGPVAEALRAARAARQAYLADAVPRFARATRSVMVTMGRGVAGWIEKAADSLGTWVEGQERARRDRWLGQATDASDLERRIRVLERPYGQGRFLGGGY